MGPLPSFYFQCSSRGPLWALEPWHSLGSHCQATFPDWLQTPSPTFFSECQCLLGVSWCLRQSPASRSSPASVAISVEIIGSLTLVSALTLHFTKFITSILTATLGGWQHSLCFMDEETEKGYVHWQVVDLEMLKSVLQEAERFPDH